MKFLLLIRHGEVKVSKKILYGEMDIPLSEKGKRDSRRLVEALSKFEIKAIYTSPLKRCLYPAEILSKKLKISLQIRKDLKEINFGKWTGKTWKELADNLEFWNFYKDENFKAPEGESLKDLRERAKKFLEYFKKEAPNGLTVVFTHAGIIRSVFVEIFNLPTSQFFNIEVLPLKINLFEFYPDEIVVLKLWNADIQSFKKIFK